MPLSQDVILLADESPFFRTMEKQFLRNAPVTVLEAQSSAEVLALCRQRPPQLIFLAESLVAGQGVPCCCTLRTDPALADIPMVFVCESAAPAERSRCCANGCQAVLTKPLDRYRFLETGRKFLAGIRERRRSCLIEVRAQGSGIALEARGLDLSSGGLFLGSSEPLALGTELQLELRLARPQENGSRISCRGTVAWLNTRSAPIKPQHPVGCGIKFTAIAPDAAATLADYLRDLDRLKTPSA